MSRNSEAHKLVGELLLAAKLQEGLRQAVVESIDECSKEGFIYILKVIIENNLTRFSSVTRAFCTWTGLLLDVDRPKTIKKCFEVAYSCLTNKAYKNECIASADNLLIYIGIWSVAFEEVEDIDTIIADLLSADEKYKKLTALQFLYDTQFTIFKHQMACNVLTEKDLEVLALAVKNLFSGINCYSLSYNPNAAEAYYKLQDNCHGSKLFNSLKNIVDMMPKKEIEFKDSVFEGVNFKLTTAEILDKMVLSISMNYDNETVNILIDYKEKMSADTRQKFIEIFLKKPETTKQKTALIEACGDRSSSVRQSAFKLVNELSLGAEDYKLIENFLQYKSGDLRKSAIKLLIKQESKELSAAVERLINSGNENKRLAAIDMVSAMEGMDAHKKIYAQCLAEISSINAASQKESLLIESMVKDIKNDKTFENGFGLYDRAQDFEPAAIEIPKDFDIKSVLSMKGSEFQQILSSFSNLIHENRDFEYEYTGWDGTKRTITLGGEFFLQPFTRDNHTLDNYPLSDKVKELSNSLGLEGAKVLELDFYLEVIRSLGRNTSYLAWYRDIMIENFNYKMLEEAAKSINKLPYYNIVREYVRLIAGEMEKEKSFEYGKQVSQYLYAIIPTEKHHSEYYKEESTYYYYQDRKDYIAQNRMISYWFYLMMNNFTDDESFKQYFSICYSYYKASQYTMRSTLGLEDFGRALELGIVNENEIYKELMDRPLSAESIQTITNIHRHDRNNLRKFNRLIEIGNIAVDTIASIEVTRGELNTEVTPLAARINKCYGAHIFTAIILSSEKDTYVRGYNFVNGDSTKKQIFSHLLKCCYPKAEESAITLGAYLKGKKVTDKQLIEAAMYSPQWLDIISDYLNYEGLKSACWYFHAHVNEYFSEEKTSIIARFTPISVQDLKDGAFDQKWFLEAYNTIGEKRFKLVYDSAKYIAGGGLHKRSQLFADATLGKLDIVEVKNRVMDKRNKDYLLTYGLIPIKSKEDLLERYEYIHQYIKESKQFGAQRQASEGRSAAIALLNLARNAGYSDVNRLTWNMETAKLDFIRPYLQPYKVEEVELQLVIDKLGQTEILCTKDGKVLKDIPAKLKKYNYVIELKALKKSLKDQYIRARHSFETAMEMGEEFKGSELINLCANPVLAPIINNLVFMSNGKLGYIREDSLVDYNNNSSKLRPEDNVIIAHPVHLYEAQCWSDFQKDIFLKQMTQPFKQVFRELYQPNEDELKEQTLSRRYAGHQVQPKKAAALLKSRGWTASHEEGLQKVYYGEDIVATIYAAADWFSPADIEAPTIEYVSFENRKTFKPVSIDQIPKLIFSEVMRDVDLVVSVAHVGGVDPEASLSTLEIRYVIVDELLKLLKLENVLLKGSHAHITGVHGEYTVHLGSGVVHKMGTGAINILPVHSSHRGRIFLPFVDSDPKSAEVISKIILLAEDKKLKDPSILEQITS